MRSLLYALSLTLFAAPALASDGDDNDGGQAEVVVAIADLPAAVTQAILARYLGATLSKVETKNGPEEREGDDKHKSDEDDDD